MVVLQCGAHWRHPSGSPVLSVPKPGRRQSRAFVRPLLRKELMFSRITPSFTPESRGKEHQQCKDLKTTKQHVGNQDPFSHRVHTGKVISNHAKPWPQVIQCRNN